MKPQSSLLELAPNACCEGGSALTFNGGIRVPVHLPPQTILHWFVGSAVDLMDVRWRDELLDLLLKHGASLSRLTNLQECRGPTYDFQKKVVLTKVTGDPNKLTEVVFDVRRASPVGAALLSMNQTAFDALLLAADRNRIVLDPLEASVFAEDADKLGHTWTLWDASAVLRSTDVIGRLQDGFGLGVDDSDQRKSLGNALAVAIAFHRMQTKSHDFLFDALGRSTRALVEAGADLSSTEPFLDDVDASLLYRLCMEGNDQQSVNAIRKLHVQGLDPNPKLYGAESPLHRACTQCFPQCFALLLNAGADLNRLDNEGRTVKQLAAIHPETERVLHAWEARQRAASLIENNSCEASGLQP